MTVRQLLREIDSYELTEWIAFSQIEPFGGTVDDLRAGINPAVTANVMKPDAPMITPLQFFPWHESTLAEAEAARQKAMTPEERSRLIKEKIFHVKPEIDG